MTLVKKQTGDADDRKSNRAWIILISVLVLLFFWLIFLYKGGMPYHYAMRAGGVWKFLSLVCLGAGWFVGYKAKDWASHWFYYVISLGLIFLSIAIAAGFNFDHMGLPNL